MDDSIHVVAAILSKDDKVYICKRPKEKYMEGLWEFPGGKIEKGETPEAALIRECQEELSITIAPDGLYHQWAGMGKDGPLMLSFYKADILEGEISLSEHTKGEYVYPAQLPAFDLCPADLEAAEMLAAEPGPRPLFTHCIWDFDGTLFDTYPRIVKAIQKALRDFGHKVSYEEIFPLAKQSISVAMKTLEERYGTESLHPRYRHHEDTMSKVDVLPYPGIPQLLTALHQAGCKHYIYTHRGASTHEYIENAGLIPLFADIITKHNGFPAKPAPDAIQSLLKKHDISPIKAAMIGDRDIDVVSGINAGIAGILYDPDDQYGHFETPLRVTTIEALSSLLWSGESK